MAAVLLAACATRKTAHMPAPVQDAKVAVPTAATVSSKPHADKKPASVTTEKNTALPTHEVGYYLDVLQGRLQQRLESSLGFNIVACYDQPSNEVIRCDSRRIHLVEFS